MDLSNLAIDLTKIDAISIAHKMSAFVGAPCYAIETKFGWTCADRKPSLRYGKVIECYQGKDLHA
jgi:hypothetical protein